MTSGSPVSRAAAMWRRKPGLADRYHLGVPAAGDEVLSRDVRLLMRVMRMRPHRTVDIGESLGYLQQLVELAHPGRNGDDPPYPGRRRPLDNGVEVRGEVREVEMAVAVDEHGG
jgi:hypothetical protein